MKKLFTMLVLLALVGWSGVLNTQNGESVIEEKSPLIDSSKSITHSISMLRSNLLAQIINPDTWNYISLTKSSDLSVKFC